ncbi:response regulator [Plasticicumulans sp.]|uniref:response regulator n=1 Tax=Plasticicumulans sp. TaxID=2307179 RepID=UPI000FA7C902|nr:response regulator [Plasticicumulans sp.]MBS0601737.1 response regulator [Pseudomonadota bacterium]RTK98573.1 MAG: response regulator [Xanthomonadales bacterium]HMW31187.1 response regulator [Plasticicumulans sp.]HMW43210.1 response regulator [Plasticicumulans sp.]HMZ11396.1 response regulator [Plasticicumulans sp.]
MPEPKPLTLLIVDDSHIIRRRIERSVAIDGLDIVGTAADGDEAVRKFRKLLPDAVTMDLTMPGMDGLQTISAVLAIRPDTRILVVSALADRSTAIEAIRRGARGFLYKPFDDAQLNEALTELLELH